MKCLAANWKANKTIEEAKEWLRELLDSQAVEWSSLRIVVCVPFTVLSELKKQLAVQSSIDGIVFLGAQNIAPFPSGSYTGEVSAEMLAGLADYVIIGHSERRRYFKETNEMVVQKIQMALRYKITPIVCLDEPYLENQIKLNLQSSVANSQLIFAYEPLSAIGSGKPAKPENGDRVAGKIKRLVPDAPVLYGGSVNSNNAKSFMSRENIDGLLVGRASLNVEEFVKIIQVVC